MIKVLKQAIEKVNGLSEDRQEYAALLLEDLAADSDPAPLSAEMKAMIRQGLEDVRNRRFVAPAAMQALLDRYIA